MFIIVCFDGNVPYYWSVKHDDWFVERRYATLFARREVARKVLADLSGEGVIIALDFQGLDLR